MSKLVLNKDAATIVSLSTNLLPSSVRVDNLEGKEYTVVPMVMMTEGVHHGSQGPMLYPKEELSKTPEVWNHKPVVVYHPTMNGQSISACDPVIINSRKVGLIMNTKFEGGKLKAEAWIDVARANEVDERIMVAVKNSEMMELSTGVYVDAEAEEGTFGSEAYEAVARNYRPDHLALLPDQIGACSIADGAGFLRNQARKRNISMDVLRVALEKIGLAANELSHTDIQVKLHEALSDRFGTTGTDMAIWVMDVFQNFVIYEMNGHSYRLGYTSNDTEVVLSTDEPVEVERVSEYRTVQNTTESKTMEKKELIDALIGNAGWEESDRKALDALSVEQLKRIQPTANAEGGEGGSSEGGSSEGGAATTTPADDPKSDPKPAATTPPADPENSTDAPAGNAKVISVADYVAAAPVEVQEVLNNGISTYNAQKQEVVDAILANEQNAFTKEELNSRPLGELRKMAQLMAVAKEEGVARQPHYAGQAPTPAGNAQVEEAMTMPTMNFEKK